jgi:hypothetical protein
VTISELPLPPTVPAIGVCTNPSGCVSANWGALGSPGFFWDPHDVLVGVTYAGAPGSNYDGPQVLLVKTDGSTFPGGDPWKCLTCGVSLPTDPATNTPAITVTTYPPPHALPGDHQVLVGNGILQCGHGDVPVTDPSCTTANTHIYPIYWGSHPLGAPVDPTNPRLGTYGREWRLNPDGVHLGWSQLVTSPTFNEFLFMGRLTFDDETDPAHPRYNLTNISLLPNAAPYVVAAGDQLQFEPHQMIGEFRGWTSDGQSLLGIQSYDSDSIDAWATSLATGRSVPLTNHAEYTDPMFMSPNGEWLLAEEVLGSGRLDFISGMRGIPPLTDQLTTTGYVSGIRNNFNRRFFLPWLVAPDGNQNGQVQAKSEQINAGSGPFSYQCTPENPAFCWNAAADPVWLADSTGVVWAENLACGANTNPPQFMVIPPPCSKSTEPGGRNSRVMIARFPTLQPSVPSPPAPVSDTVPWGIPFTLGQTPLPTQTPALPPGTFTLQGNIRGSASVVVTDNTSGLITSIAVTYHDFTNLPGYVINGTESVENNGTNNPFAEMVTWFENLTLSGRHIGSKVTTPCASLTPTCSNGFTLGFQTLILNNFQASGTITTTIDGNTYTQPANGT